jgi:hypothetical protein
VNTWTTAEAAHAAGVHPSSFARWAKARGLEPLHRVRIGRSTVTVWLRAAVVDAGARAC